MEPSDRASKCPNCHIGSLRRGCAPYAAWHGGALVVVPDMPTWLCDVCGLRTYDADILDSLLPLLGRSKAASNGEPSDDPRHRLDPSERLGGTRTRRRA